MAHKIDKSRVVAGRLIKVKNTTPKISNAKSEYFAIWIEDANEKNERCLLLTKKELEKMEYRAKRNPEDVPPKSLLTDLFD